MAVAYVCDRCGKIEQGKYPGCVTFYWRDKTDREQVLCDVCSEVVSKFLTVFKGAETKKEV